MSITSSRRTAMKFMALGALTPWVARAAAAPETQLFALTDVRLLGGPFARAQTANRRYIAALEIDRLLSGFRSEAGLVPKAAKYGNWENIGLDGHTAGHYLSALAQEAASGDREMLSRLQYLVSELAAVQRANGDGYVGAVPGSRALWDDVREGKLKGNGFSFNDKWVPFYNLHKTYAGLRDAWLIAGNRQAREVLIGFADWCDHLVAKLSDEQLQGILSTEHGGMNEVLADVYAITGDAKYLKLAKRFSHRKILDPLLAREDKLDGLHANTQIPKVIGFARIGELSGDQSWVDAAAYFWERVTQHRSVAFGGNSVREHFNSASNFTSVLESREGPETCNTYNMLRLSAQLYRLDSQPRYAEYMERALFNHILSSQHPEHGGLVYFTPIRPRQYRVYSQPSQCFWCCVGTGMENHGKHAGFAYAHDERSLTVNLFIASELQWRARDVVLKQATSFPDEASTQLTFSLKKPQRFVLKLRHPQWISGPLSVRINGRDTPVKSTPGSYASIERLWSDGDRIDLALPMSTRIERLPDGSDYVAVMHGPIVLAAKTSSEDMPGLIADDSRGGHIAQGPYEALEKAPMLIGNARTLAAQITPIPGQPLSFKARSLIQPASFRELELQPLFRTHDARYMVYWRTATAEAYPAVLKQIEAQEKAALALEARTVDRVIPGEQQPEVDHQFKGENSQNGVTLGRGWRDAGAWFSYRLKKTADTAGLVLQLTFFGAEKRSGFKLLVNDREIATIDLKGGQPDRFIELTYPISAEALALGDKDSLVVKLQAPAKGRTGSLYDLRLLKPELAPRA